MIKHNNKKQKGFALLFTVIIVSAISVITAGLSNAAYKQLILSSLAKDSQTAFFQADTASDCALYLDQVEYSKYLANTQPNAFTDSSGEWKCGELNLKISPDPVGGLPAGYSLTPPEPDAITPCFRINIKREVRIPIELDIDNNPIIDTTISAKGYNICNLDNLRTVEREIQVQY